VTPATDTGRRSAWRQARQLARRTPEARHRYVDLLRAASITVAVIGRWLMAAPWVEDGELRLGDMLHLAPWSQWMTWVFQVMSVFFVVGGEGLLVLRIGVLPLSFAGIAPLGVRPTRRGSASG
jgi:hypothetical protein